LDAFKQRASYNLKRSTISGSGYVTLTNLIGIKLCGQRFGLTNHLLYVVSATNYSGESINSIEVSVTPVWRREQQYLERGGQYQLEYQHHGQLAEQWYGRELFERKFRAIRHTTSSNLVNVRQRFACLYFTEQLIQDLQPSAETLEFPALVTIVEKWQ